MPLLNRSRLQLLQRIRQSLAARERPANPASWTVSRWNVVEMASGFFKHVTSANADKFKLKPMGESETKFKPLEETEA